MVPTGSVKECPCCWQHRSEDLSRPPALAETLECSIGFGSGKTSITVLFAEGPRCTPAKTIRKVQLTAHTCRHSPTKACSLYVDHGHMKRTTPPGYSFGCLRGVSARHDETEDVTCRKVLDNSTALQQF